jgi:hypothetical protein
VVVPLTPLDDAALTKVINSFSDNPHLVGLLGAVIYAGSMRIRETESGTHFYLECPNSRTAKELHEYAFVLFMELNTVFPVTRLLISTTQDPFVTVPADYWKNQGWIPLPDGTYVGLGGVEHKPNWYAVVKLDEEGRLVREK